MTQPQPLRNYVMTFPKDEDGHDVKYRFMLTLGKKLSEKVVGNETIESRLQKALGNLNGIDGVGGGGNYTIEIAIARSFNAAEVIQEIETRLDEQVFNTIITPKLVQP